MKTRQQRLAEERAGHPPSPPQALSDNPRGPRRIRAKTPRVAVAVESVEPVAQPAVRGEPLALLQLWADAARAGDDPTHTFVVGVSRLPELTAWMKAKATNQGGPDLPLTSSASAHATNSPSMNSRSPSMSPPLEFLTNAELPHNLRNQAHLPAYNKDGMAFYGIVPRTSTPGLVASSNTPQMAEKIGDEAFASDAFADEDTDMDEASESDSSTSHLAESSFDEDASESHSTSGHLAESTLLEGTQSAPGPSDTPRGSRWGSWFQSARSSLRSRFGFSPLTPVSERSEPTTPLTQMRINPTPKKAASMPTSARATRAKSRRHSGLLCKPIKRGQKPRGNKASSKKSPAMSPTHQDEEEAQQAQSGQPNRPTLCPPRSLDRMQTSLKRKRLGEPVEQESVKLRRIGEKIYFSSQQPQVKMPIAITNSEGSFKVPSPSDSDGSDSGEGERGFRVPSPSDSDGSDDDEDEANVITKADDNLGGKRGFRAPSPCDSDGSDGNEDEAKAIVKGADNFGPTGGQNFHAYQEWCKTATPAVVAALGGMEVDPQIAGEAFEGGLDQSKASGEALKSLPRNLQPFTPLCQYGISPRVEAYLDSQWDEEDRRAAVTGFERAFQIFQENEAAAAAAAIAT